MKNLVLLSVLVSSFSYASDIDYSRCMQVAGFGLNINNDSQIESNYYDVQSKETKGNVENYVLKDKNNSPYGISSELKLKITRDDQGRIIKFVSGSDKPSAKDIEAYKDGLLKGTVSENIFRSHNYSSMPFNPNMSNKVNFNEQAQNKLKSSNIDVMESSFPIEDEEGKWIRFVPVSQITKAQAKKIGLDSETIKDLKRKWNRDKKTKKRLEKNLKKIFSKYNPTLYLGNEVEFEIADGSCYPKRIATRVYNSNEKKLITTNTFTKDICPEIQKIYKNHAVKMDSCQTQDSKIFQDLQNSPALSKTFQSEGIGHGGYGSAGGYGIGYGVGINGNAYNYGVSPAQNLRNMQFNCEQYTQKTSNTNSSNSKVNSL